MKKIVLLFSSFIVLLIGACDSDNETTSITNFTDATDGNIFNSEDIEEGYWIAQSGKELEAENMIISNPIPYNPDLNYEANNTFYVTYMDGDEILETRLHGDGPPPIELETVEEANQIRISFDNGKLEGFELIVK